MVLEHCGQGPWCEPASGGQAEADSEAWLTGTALLRLLPIGGRRSGSDTRYTGPAPRQASPTRAGASTSVQDWVHTATLRRPRHRAQSEEAGCPGASAVLG